MKLAPVALLASLCLSLHAKDLAAYRVGDTADTGIVTPLPLDVVDAEATAALKAAKATQYPAVFRSVNVTNALAQEFTDAFGKARTDFVAELNTEFHSPMPGDATIASPDFSRLVTAFDATHKTFPVTEDLAATWARGNDGSEWREKLLARLLAAQSRCLCPEALPSNVVLGQNIRAVPVTDPDAKLSFDTVDQAPLVSASNVMTVAAAQMRLRSEFGTDQQLFARALAALLRANCFFDAPFTQLSRGEQVYQLTVSAHFDAGDVIVRQGSKVDAKAKAALDALKEKLSSPTPTPAVAPVAAVAATAPPTHKPEVASPTAAVPASPLALRHRGVIIGLGAISAVALFIAVWQFIADRKRTIAAMKPEAKPVDATDPNVTPHVAQAVREAVQQELASQRRELLLAQQAAAAEIMALVARLDTLQVPASDRVHTYEMRIKALEKDLALRNEENRELLRLKIEMINRQLQNERAGTVVTVTAA